MADSCQPHEDGRATHRALARQAVVLLRELEPLARCGRYVFPSLLTRDRPMSNNTINTALRRLGYASNEQTGHGFRSMASTLLNEQGFSPDVIELQLAHSERNKVRAAYNKAKRLPERRKMMQAWADYLPMRNSERSRAINAPRAKQGDERVLESADWGCGRRAYSRHCTGRRNLVVSRINPRSATSCPLVCESLRHRTRIWGWHERPIRPSRAASDARGPDRR